MEQTLQIISKSQGYRTLNISPEVINKFNETNKIGLDNLEKVLKKNPFDVFDLNIYYKECISFDLTENKMEGLELFLQKIKN